LLSLNIFYLLSYKKDWTQVKQLIKREVSIWAPRTLQMVN